MKKYKNSQEHIQDNINLIDRQLTSLQFKKSRIDYSVNYQKDKDNNQNNLDLEKNESHIKQLSEQISTRENLSVECGINLKLNKIKNIFGLSDIEYKILLLCIVQRTDLKYEKIISFFYNDNIYTKINIDFAIKFLASNIEQKVIIENALKPESKLLKYCLIQLNPSTHTKGKLSTELEISERIYEYLFDIKNFDNPEDLNIQLINNKDKLDEIYVSEDLNNKINRIINFDLTNSRQSNNCIISLYGPVGTGKKSILLKICKQKNKSLLVADLQKAYVAGNDLVLFIKKSIGEALLLDSFLYINNIDFLFEDESLINSKLEILGIIKNCENLVFLGSEKRTYIDTYINSKLFYEIEFIRPGLLERKKIWDYYIKKYKIKGKLDTEILSSMYKLTGGQIVNIIKSIMQNLLNINSCEITLSKLQEYCRKHSIHNLNNLASKVKSTYNWNDLVMPQDQKNQLKEITKQVIHKNTVYGEWKFSEKHSQGKGVNVLFYGISGTGKTMAAGIIAKELGLDLYKIDLSTIVSKYIGETEKNLNKIFNEAEYSNAILLFDEADALFGKRSEVKDAHDRYANIEVGYLLQKMDEYQGIVILTSNMMNNMDSAFERRMHYIVEFPFPDAEDRLIIWKNVLPETVPIEDIIDYEFIAKSFNISGGNIKNIAHAACFYAADDKSKVTTEHLIKATKREYQKIGKACMQNEFGKYYELVQ